ncbi:MAG: hypothetical protein JWM97_2960 [Phycisphaerales bacterium]|nr:hypothetical protein [Phycisphaerales bacterium]
MNEIESEARVESEAQVGPVISNIHTDTFCESCGYNLHTQAVVRDERLGLLVCRCPECGRWAAAGLGTSASRVWLNRFGTLLLIGWVLVLLVVFGLGTLFMGMLPYGYLMSFTRWQQFEVPAPGMPGQHLIVYRYTLQDVPPADSQAASDQRTGRTIFMCVATALAAVVGGLHSVFLWHARGRWRVFAFAMPLLACLGTWVIWNADRETVDLRQWAVPRIALFFLLELLGLSLGLLAGRPIVRGLLRVLLPPKPRQHLAFLWTVDKKRLPI